MAPPAGQRGLQWLDFAREQPHSLTLSALEAVTQRLTFRNRLGLALTIAQSATRLDPLRESATRVFSGIHLRDGNSAAAWTEYRRPQAQLHVETGSLTSPSVTSLVAEIRITSDAVLADIATSQTTSRPTRARPRR
ncbi:hypothetical protein GCM10022204_23090 [Microlunatus aurantiacus]|uniref:Bacterial transcriptional activator domain-containing protein n=1 Tax=Microlunatus aurantiacus TaxID=446786 RepID=A0ABP7DIV5_9ACTN